MIHPRFWLNPIGAVAIREIRIHMRYKSWFVASFVWPIIFPLTYIYFGRGLAGPSGQGLSSFETLAATRDFASFLIIGNLVWMFVNINLWMGGLSLRTDRMRGTFDTHWTMPASKVSLVLGATIASLLLNFLPMLFSILFYSVIGVLPVRGNLPAVLAASILVLPFLFGFLLLFSALTMRVREAGKIVQVLRTAFAVLCGMQFPLSVLPVQVRAVSAFIPLTHYVQLIRGIVIEGKSLEQFVPSILFMTASGIVMLVLGVVVFELTRRVIQRRGLGAGY